MKTILDYAELVKEQHALNTIIAPVEADLTSASKAYAVGQKFIHDGVLYQAKTAIAQGAALVLNTNYEAADDVSSEIQTLTNKLDDEIATRATLGAHNLFPLLFSDIKKWNTGGTWSGNVYSYKGLTYTVTADGDLVTDILVNGTASGASNLLFLGSGGDAYSYLFKKGVYRLSGCPAISGCALYFVRRSPSGAHTPDYGSGVIVTIDSDTYCNSYFTAANATVVSNAHLKPLLTLASDSSTEFTPYAMTNRELTDELLGNYVIVEERTTLAEVTVSTSDTIGAKLNDLWAALKTRVNAMSANELCIPEAILGTNINPCYSMQTNVLKSNDTSVDSDFVRNSVSDNFDYTIANYLKLRQSASKFGQVVIYVSGTNTGTNNTNNNFTANGSIKVTGRIVKKI